MNLCPRKTLMKIQGPKDTVESLASKTLSSTSTQLNNDDIMACYDYEDFGIDGRRKSGASAAI